MPVFSYRATTRQGDIVEGVIDAPDQPAAIERLKGSGIIPLRVASAAVDSRKRLPVPFGMKKRRDAVLTFTAELSSLLSAGLALDRSLNILAEISANSDMKGIIQSILRAIREGSSFSESLRRHPDYFPNIYVNMIKAGEAGGVLDIVLDKLNEFLESSRELRESVVSAMIYPLILAFTGAISILVLLTYILPRFSVIFDELGGAIPLPTKILLLFSGVLKSYWWLFLIAFIAAYLLFRTAVSSGQGRVRWDGIKLKLTGEIIRRLETARFTRTLGTLLKSGVPMLQALSNAKDVISNSVMANAIDTVFRGAKEGKGIADPLAKTGVFPQLALSMIKVGEETGQLDEMLLTVAQDYEKGLRVEIRRFMSLLEPAMILIMAVIIGFIVISMLMAIFSITELPF